jgi:type IV secretory pathway VirB10-like protein
MPVLIEKQKALSPDEVIAPRGAPADPSEPQKDLGFFVSKRKLDLGQNSSRSMIFAGVVAVGLLALVFGMSHRDTPGSKKAAAAKPVAAIKEPVKQDGATVPGDHGTDDKNSKRDDATTAADVENTKNRNPDAAKALDLKPSAAKTAGAPRQNLGGVPPFRSPTYSYGNGPAPALSPYVNTIGANDPSKAYQDAVTKPSYVFSAAASTTGSGISGSAGGGEPVTNFGLEPGLHVSAHLESSISTIGGVPAVAIIEYDYVRGGRVIIPAGSRVIGKMGGASSTGLVQVAFTEIYLPNGARIPINAVGLDSSLRLLKGVVTGKNTGKQILLGALSSIGSLGAGFLNSNNNNAITQADLARNQIASNLGRSGDQAIQQMQVGQSIVVTVPSGTLVYVTFVAPSRGAVTEATASRGTTAHQ